MRWISKDKAIKDNTQGIWFAWHPVRLFDTDTYVWLERVLRIKEPERLYNDMFGTTCLNPEYPDYRYFINKK